MDLTVDQILQEERSLNVNSEPQELSKLNHRKEKKKVEKKVVRTSVICEMLLISLTNVYLDSQKERRENEKENTLEDIMAENFQIW